MAALRYSGPKPPLQQLYALPCYTVIFYGSFDSILYRYLASHQTMSHHSKSRRLMTFLTEDRNVVYLCPKANYFGEIDLKYIRKGRPRI